MRNGMSYGQAGYLGFLKGNETQKRNRLKKIEEYNKNPKLCKYCNEPIPYDKRENVYCNRSCRTSCENLGIVRNGKPAGSCKFCGNKLGKAGNKYCSPKCQAEYQYRAYIKRWLDNKEIGYKGKSRQLSTYIKRWLRETRGNKCEVCGWNEINPYTGNVPVQADHIDGNAENCRPENLKLLCPNHHSLTPTFGALNKGNGRKFRKDLFSEKD